MILLTGSDGFIGRNLSKFLNSEIVYRLDRSRGDVFDQLSLVPWNRIEKIIHLGAITNTTATDLDELHYYNVKFSIRLFELAIKYQIPVQYASSASVYGNGQGPLNHYAVSKLSVDLWVQENLIKFKEIHGYRFFNVYGIDENKGSQSSPIFTFTNQARTDSVIRIFSDEGDGSRDFIWVDDVCRILLNESRESGIYDCGTGNSITFSKIAEIISKKTGARIEIIPFPDHLKNKYQYFTKAEDADLNCISVSDYLEKLFANNP